MPSKIEKELEVGKQPYDGRVACLAEQEQESIKDLVVARSYIFYEMGS